MTGRPTVDIRMRAVFHRGSGTISTQISKNQYDIEDAAKTFRKMRRFLWLIMPNNDDFIFFARVKLYYTISSSHLTQYFESNSVNHQKKVSKIAYIRHFCVFHFHTSHVMWKYIDIAYRKCRLSETKLVAIHLIHLCVLFKASW